MPFRPRDGERDAIALARPAPRAPDGVGHPGRLPRPASAQPRAILPFGDHEEPDRKSTRLNSSHLVISYAVFCLKKKKNKKRKKYLCYKMISKISTNTLDVLLTDVCQ